MSGEDGQERPVNVEGEILYAAIAKVQSRTAQATSSHEP